MADTFLLLLFTIAVVCMAAIVLSLLAEALKRWLVRKWGTR